MKLIAVSLTSFILASSFAIAGESEDVSKCPDYRMDGDRVIVVCDPDKLAEGDFLSPTEFAQGFGGALTSAGGGESGSGSSSSR